MLTDTQKEIIRVFAESGMNRTEASRRLFRHYNTIYYQLIRIKEKTELNPWDFFDLHELLRMAGAADYVDVVRCKDCIYSRPIDREDSYEAFFGEDCVWCTENDVGMHNHGFCSKGERKNCGQINARMPEAAGRTSEREVRPDGEDERTGNS